MIYRGTETKKKYLEISCMQLGIFHKIWCEYMGFERIVKMTDACVTEARFAFQRLVQRAGQNPSKPSPLQNKIIR